jgi:hypothetical protein
MYRYTRVREWNAINSLAEEAREKARRQAIVALKQEAHRFKATADRESLVPQTFFAYR